MEILNTALQGLARAEALLERTAGRVARLPVSREAGDMVKLSEEMVGLMEARTSQRANLRSLRTAGEMARETIKLFG